MAEKHRSTTGNTPPDGTLTRDLLAQLENTLWLPHDMDEATRSVRIGAARALLADIEPAPGIESMLACQMVAVHAAAMACLGRSAAPEASPEQTDRNLRHAERLLAIYARQTDVLGRHRCREQRLEETRDKARRNREEQQAEQEEIIIRHVLYNPDGTVATPEQLAEDRARRIADGTLVSTPPRDRSAAQAGVPPQTPPEDDGTGDTPSGGKPPARRSYLVEGGI